jgi:hypothetical protein
MEFFYKWLAGATMFEWGGLSHSVLIKGIGCTCTSNEEQIVSTLRICLPADCLFFPKSISEEPHK